MMEYLLVLNDSPYGSQRTYNALRLAGALAKGATMAVSIFLLGDGVVSGLRMQSPADASYNVQEMLRLLAAQGVSIGACRTCLEARGIDDASLVAGIKRYLERARPALAHDQEPALLLSKSGRPLSTSDVRRRL